MLSYELCKKLKDAGFPQYFSKNVYNGNGVPEYYKPTLEELIEGCGKSFSLISRNPITDQWTIAYYNSDKEFSALGEYFSTPSSAVAQLYLAINPVKK